MVTVVAWSAGVLAAVLLLLNANAWRNTRRIHQRIALRELIETIRTVRASHLYAILLLTVGLLAWFAVLGPIYLQFIPVPIFFLVLATCVDNISRRIMPPSVLLLTASRAHGVMLALQVRRRLMREFVGGVRTCVLLKAQVSGTLAFDYVYIVGVDNLRQRSPADWTAAVSRLMCMAPVIVLDLRHNTGAMETEEKLIRDLGLGYKTSLLTLTGSDKRLDPCDTAKNFTQSDRLVENVARRLHALSIRAQS